MDKKYFIEYLRSSQVSNNHISSTDVVFLRNYIHYRKNELVPMEKIEDTIRHYAESNILNKAVTHILYAIDYMMVEFNILLTFDKKGNIIHYS